MEAVRRIEHYDTDGFAANHSGIVHPIRRFAPDRRLAALAEGIQHMIVGLAQIPVQADAERAFLRIAEYHGSVGRENHELAVYGPGPPIAAEREALGLLGDLPLVRVEQAKPRPDGPGSSILGHLFDLFQDHVSIRLARMIGHVQSKTSSSQKSSPFTLPCAKYSGLWCGSKDLSLTSPPGRSFTTGNGLVTITPRGRLEGHQVGLRYRGRE